MELRRLATAIAVLSCVAICEARGLARRSPKDADLKAIQVQNSFRGNSTAQKAHITPALSDSASDTKFYKKDYPFDKRPKADPFHFHHPYPAVQDSGDFDKDYVKDENSDNGYWKAQTTYDKLRQQVRKEKSDVEKAAEQRERDEEDLKKAMKRHEQAKEAIAARKKAEEEARIAKEAAEKEQAKKDANNQGGATGEGLKKDLSEASDETQSAMGSLEDCKKELKAAQDKLKDLMKDLEEAKTEQQQADAVVDGSYSHELQAEQHEKELIEKVKKESSTYQESREAYLKQKAVVDKLEADIRVAASKVQAMRDAEDKNGGVYPTGTKSGATGGAPFFGAVALMLIGSLA